MYRISTVVTLALAVSTSAYAQTRDRSYLQAIGGVTFGTEPSQLFAGGVGVPISHGIYLTFEAGRMADVLPKSVRREFDDVVRTFSEEEGVPVTAAIKAPATYFATGVRFAPAVPGRIDPFLAFTVGTTHISPKLSFNVDGSRMTATDDDLEEAGLSPSKQPLIGIGAGIEIVLARRFGIELGYQYNRIFTEDPVVNTHRAFMGANVKF
jgi:hypothetical protein